MIYLLLLLQLAFAGGLSVEGLSRIATTRQGDTVPDFTLLIGGERRLLSDVEGVRVLEFGATTCRPCMASLDHLNWVASFYEDKGVTYLAVFVDEDAAAIEQALAARELPNLVIAQVTEDTRRTMLHGRSAWPTTLILDPTGLVLAAYRGHQPDDNRSSKTLKAYFRELRRAQRRTRR